MLDRPKPSEQVLLFPEDEIETNDTTFRLGRLEVYNWGPFGGLHREMNASTYGTDIRLA